MQRDLHEPIRLKLDTVNIQYQYECSDSVNRKAAKERAAAGVVWVDTEDHVEGPPDMVNERMHDHFIGEEHMVGFTQADVNRKMVSEYSPEDRAYAEVTINIAMDVGIFVEEPPEWVWWKDLAMPAMYEQMAQFQLLEKLVQEVTKSKALDDQQTDIAVREPLITDRCSSRQRFWYCCGQGIYF
jgi:hypothetical protein